MLNIMAVLRRLYFCQWDELGATIEISLTEIGDRLVE